MAAGQRTITIMFTDLVGSTELIGALGEEAADVVRSQHFDLLSGAAATHAGTVVKNLGDGLMLTFPSALSAVEAAVVMHAGVAEHQRRG
jgi:adenylate cyclase